MGKMTPIISVCIPVYQTEKLLEKCLVSIVSQKPVAVANETSHSEKNISLAEKIVPPFEIVIVNDASSGKDERGRSCENIVKDFEKSLGKKRGLFTPKKNAEELPPAADKITGIKYIEHGKNRGIVETRRTLVEAAEGSYICMLDSDDTLTENALAVLYDAAVTSGADIVQSGANVITAGAESRTQVNLERANNIFCGTLLGKQILDGYLIDRNHSCFLWAKLFKRELCLDAFSHIPNVFCSMTADVLQYFWTALLAKTYYGFEDRVYNYNIDGGITSDVIITDLERWKRVCSTSSTFVSIFQELQNADTNTFELTEEEKASLTELAGYYVYNNLMQLKYAVDDSIKTAAYEMLCDFWGKEKVERVQIANNLEIST